MHNVIKDILRSCFLTSPPSLSIRCAPDRTVDESNGEIANEMKSLIEYNNHTKIKLFSFTSMIACVMYNEI